MIPVTDLKESPRTGYPDVYYVGAIESEHAMWVRHVAGWQLLLAPRTWDNTPRWKRTMPLESLAYYVGALPTSEWGAPASLPYIDDDGDLFLKRGGRLVGCGSCLVGDARALYQALLTQPDTEVVPASEGYVWARGQHGHPILLADEGDEDYSVDEYVYYSTAEDVVQYLPDSWWPEPAALSEFSLRVEDGALVSQSTGVQPGVLFNPAIAGIFAHLR